MLRRVGIVRGQVRRYVNSASRPPALKSGRLARFSADDGDGSLPERSRAPFDGWAP